MIQPPKLARRIFSKLSGEAHVDDLLGDMDEWFYENARLKSPGTARWIYWRQVLSLSFSYALRKRKRDARHGVHASSSLSAGMLYNYVKVAVRNLYQYKYFSFINVFGLSLGMSVSLLLISLLNYVSTYDNFHNHGDRVYSIYSSVKDGPERFEYATAPLALGVKIKSELESSHQVLPVVKQYQNVLTRTQNIPIKVYYTNGDFFDFFSFPFLKGQPDALDRPGHLILNERTAKKLFGDSDPIGETVALEGGALMQVGGVIKDQKRTHLNFDVLISEASLPHGESGFAHDWVEFRNQYLYVRVPDGAGVADLEAYLGRSSAQLYRDSPAKVSFSVRPLSDIVMYRDLRNEIGEKWEATGMFLFALFAALILLPACFNYANISIARAMRRAKEIALRKTVGGVRGQIFFQFITESVVITTISLTGGILIFLLVRKEFQSMLVAGSSLDLSLTPSLLVWFLLFAIATGFFAGAFPALYFAKMNPIEAFKSRVSTRVNAAFNIRKALTVFQFVLSFGFILTLFAISRQYRYAVGFDFGFQTERLLDVPLQDVKADQCIAAFSALSSVSEIAQSSGVMGVSFSQAWLKDENRDSVQAAEMFVDFQYIRNLELTFLAGRNFSDRHSKAERELIVNEQFLKTRGIASPQDALGRIYEVDSLSLEVVGVLKDFHFAPLNYPIGNFIFRQNPERYAYLNVKVSNGNAYDVVSSLENAWKQLPTERKFIAEFFEDEVEEAYTTYLVMLKIVGFLGLMAITISLLGLVGMVMFTAQSRSREVGIRKVMGADVRHMIFLLSRDYLKMLAWAIVIGTPVAVLLLNWAIPHLQYYHADISVWDVALSVLALAGAGVATIVVETYKTASINPATTLRAE